MNRSYNPSRRFGQSGSRPHRSFQPRKGPPPALATHELMAFVNRSKEAAVGGATTPVEVFVPQHQFTDWPLAKSLQEAIVAKGYTAPTPIQDQAISHILEGRDLIGLAQTGTGKTGAFLIPLLQRMLTNEIQNVLIIAPTRELAVQIRDEFSDLTKFEPMKSALCIGGANMTSQIHSLFSNPRMVIGTPGRLKDLIDRNKLHLADTNAVVLDEVDRMLDMGFVKDIQYILEKLHTPRQSLFFSATLPPTMKNLVHSFLTNPEIVSMKANDPAELVDQQIINVRDSEDKLVKLIELLKQPEFNKVLVFGRTKFGVEKLSRKLYQSGVPTDSIHGGKFQGKRQRALDAFKSGQIRALVATDVAARGLDISQVSHVINYDLPTNLEDYIHRIGRTGRANQKGIAISFIEDRKTEPTKATESSFQGERPQYERPQYAKKQYGGNRFNRDRNSQNRNRNWRSGNRSSGQSFQRRDEGTRSWNDSPTNTPFQGKKIQDPWAPSNQENSNTNNQKDERGNYRPRRQFNRNQGQRRSYGNRRPSNRMNRF